MRRTPALPAVLLAALLSLPACGGSNSGQAGNTATKTIDITARHHGPTSRSDITVRHHGPTSRSWATR